LQLDEEHFKRVQAFFRPLNRAGWFLRKERA